jgi:CRP/FNR family transcriptional regulator, cyclic AMP receptor protein
LRWREVRKAVIRCEKFTLPSHNPQVRTAPVTADVLDELLLREIAQQGGIRPYPANAVLISEGDSSDSLFILLSGRVKVYSTNAEGKEVVITTHGAGEYVGELSLDGERRSASVMTLEPTTCSVVSGKSLRDFIAAHPDFASHLIRKLIRSVREATESVKSLALEDVYARVVRLLNDTSDPGADGQRRLREKLTQQAIADRVGASREMVSRIFKDLTVGGYLAVDAGRIVILRKLPAAW